MITVNHNDGNWTFFLIIDRVVAKLLVCEMMLKQWLLFMSHTFKNKSMLVGRAAVDAAKRVGSEIKSYICLPRVDKTVI